MNPLRCIIPTSVRVNKTYADFRRQIWSPGDKGGKSGQAQDKKGDTTGKGKDGKRKGKGGGKEGGHGGQGNDNQNSTKKPSGSSNEQDTQWCI